MDSAARLAHWQDIYTTKGEKEVSWFEDNPAASLELMALTGATSGSAVIDIGGGASRFVDALAGLGYEDITVLDLSEAALATARARLAARAAPVDWVAADVTTWKPQRLYDLWHDRAAFHFLIDAVDQAAYVDRLGRALRPGGHAIIGTFAPDGPERCSGLPVARYDAARLGQTLGSAFELIGTRRHEHTTPWGSKQSFQFCAFRHAI